MGVEDELRRVLRDENLEIPVRTGAEWSLMAGARRRRQRRNAVALAGSALAATMLGGTAVALVGPDPGDPAPQQPPPAGVVHSTSEPGRPSVPSSSAEPSRRTDTSSEPAPESGEWTDVPHSTSEQSEEPSILRSTEPSSTESSESGSTEIPEPTEEVPPPESSGESGPPEPTGSVPAPQSTR